jgi:hypothetical protein
MSSRKYSRRGVPIPLAQCITCKSFLPKRVTHLYEKELSGYLCQNCWDAKYDGADFSTGFLIDL